MKPSYHQSNIKNYLKCPMMYKLSLEYSADIGKGTQDVMREGELFEGYTLGFKSSKDETALIGKKKPETIAFIKRNAEFMQKLFKSGSAYVKLKHETKEYDLDGEADHIGQLDWEFIKTIFPEAQAEGETINDLKYTGDVERVWSEKDGAFDYFQALQYVSIHYLNTGKLLPFIFLVVEGRYDKPLLHLDKVFVHETDITTKFIPFVDKIHGDLFYDSFPSKDNCLGGKKGSRCWYLQHCSKGRAFVGGYKTTEFAYFNMDL